MAAQEEQAGNYHKAAILWLKANAVAKHPMNQAWSEARANHCLTRR